MECGHALRIQRIGKAVIIHEDTRYGRHVLTLRGAMDIERTDARCTLKRELLTNGRACINRHNDDLPAIPIGRHIDVATRTVSRTDPHRAGTYPLRELTDRITVLKDRATVGHQIVRRRLVDPPPEISTHLIVHAIADFLGDRQAIGHGGLCVVDVMFGHPDTFAVFECVLMDRQPPSIEVSSQNTKMRHRGRVVDDGVRVLVVEVEGFWHDYRFADVSSVVFHKVEDLGGGPIGPGLIVRLVLYGYPIQSDVVRGITQPGDVIVVMLGE